MEKYQRHRRGPWTLVLSYSVNLIACSALKALFEVLLALCFGAFSHCLNSSKAYTGPNVMVLTCCCAINHGSLTSPGLLGSCHSLLMSLFLFE